MNSYEKRVRQYEAQGMTRSDAQGVVDAEDLKASGLTAAEFTRREVEKHRAALAGRGEA